MTVHLVYPHGSSTSCPDAIGRNLIAHLGRHREVVAHDWDEVGRIDPYPGDVLIGHPHPAIGTVFRRSARRPGWARIIALAPYHHGDVQQVAWEDSVLRRCDRFLAITGTHWAQTMAASRFAHLWPRTTPIDLAVDPRDYPRIKHSFNPPGHRRFLYVGHAGWPKNTDYLGRITALVPETEFSWIGPGPGRIGRARAYGWMDLSSSDARSVVADHDFMISVSHADANPTTVLEAMAWGLLPVCTQESGYVADDGVITVPLDQPERAADIVRCLSNIPDDELRRRQALNWQAVNVRWTWTRFADQIMQAVDDRSPLRPVEITLGARLRLGAAGLTSPFSPLHPRQLRVSARSLRRGASPKARTRT